LTTSHGTNAYVAGVSLSIYNWQKIEKEL